MESYAVELLVLVVFLMEKVVEMWVEMLVLVVFLVEKVVEVWVDMLVSVVWVDMLPLLSHMLVL
jgi:hypothetical protein